ncbi:hypothetical protein MAMC_00581 [Methylacidimicrobium cyclopophantes]|uniref:ComE operon protein 3 n=1 Tax=Methylacidimicrobium cyclopophantes TaxID=1041766 RepID=A0A5E6M933_9BACT|nr:hypothetical protein MAMC_00581 [Methylacidimicrobium cyclopophantes]
MWTHRQPDSALFEPSSRPSASARCPLLAPALVFAAGCALGSGFPHLFLPALATVALMGALWFRSNGPRSALLPFLSAIFFSGAASASFHKGWSTPDHLRHLPKAKFAADCWWGGTIESVPIEKDRPVDRATTAIFAVHRARIAGSCRSVSGRILLDVRSAPPGALVFSQHLWVRGALQRPGKPQNPGDPDWTEIFASRRIAYRLTSTWREIRPLDAGSRLGRQITAARRWASRLLQTGIESDREAVSLLTGMLYGQTGGLPAKVEEDFRLAGAYHIFAVSGQNIAAFLAVGLALLEAGRVSRWRWGWALLPLITFYAFVSGGSASVGRAALLSSLVLAAWFLRRPVRLLNLWGACLLLFLGVEPLAVRDVSLQLSFGVLLALLLLSAPLARWLTTPFLPDPLIPRSLLPPQSRFRERFGKALGFLLGSSVAASLGALPFEIAHFHFVSLVAPLVNLLVVPLADLIVTVGVLSLFLGSLWGLLGILLNNANWLFAHGLLLTVAFASHLPGAGIAVGDPATLLSESRNLRLLFPAIPLGSACIARWKGKQLLIEGGEGTLSLARMEPIRRFYGWNWLAGTFRPEGDQWAVADPSPWGVLKPFAPFERFSRAAPLCVRPASYRLRQRSDSAVAPPLLFEGPGIPSFALALESSPEEKTAPFPSKHLSLFVERTKAVSDPTMHRSAPTNQLWLSLAPSGACLRELDPQGRIGKGRSLGRTAVEVVLEANRIEFRPYRRSPVSYTVGFEQESEGAASQTPSSPDDTVQDATGSNPVARRSRANPSRVKR